MLYQIQGGKIMIFHKCDENGCNGSVWNKGDVCSYHNRCATGVNAKTQIIMIGLIISTFVGYILWELK